MIPGTPSEPGEVVMGSLMPDQNFPGSASRDAAGLAGLLWVTPAPSFPSWHSFSLSWPVPQSSGLLCCPVLQGPISDPEAQGQTCLFGVVWRAKPLVRGGEVEAG